MSVFIAPSNSSSAAVTITGTLALGLITGANGLAHGLGALYWAAVAAAGAYQA